MRKLLTWLSICFFNPNRLHARINSKPHSVFGVLLRVVGVAWMCVLLTSYATLISLAAFKFAWLSSFAVSAAFGALLILFVLALLIKNHRDRYRKIIYKILGWMCLLFASLFVFGGVCWWFQDSRLLRLACARIEFPLVALRGLAVDEQGRIYCGQPFYSRIQAYDPNGRFLRGWFAPIERGTFQIDISAEGLVCIIQASQDYFYDREGRLVRIYRKPEETHLDEDDYDLAATDSLGDRYTIAGPLRNRIDKYSGPMTDRTLVSDPWSRWVLKHPLPGIPFLILLFVYDFAMARHRARPKKHPTRNPP